MLCKQRLARGVVSVTLSAALVFGLLPKMNERVRADSTTYDFEGLNIGWTALDADNDGYGWTQLNDFKTVYPYYEGKVFDWYHGSGTNSMLSGSYINGVGALSPDNWLISPMIRLGGSISFYAEAADYNYPADHFGVYVSTSGASPSDFTMLQEWTMTDGGWYEYSVDLSAYDGYGYVAIRHFNSYDNYILVVDDITITEPDSQPAPAGTAFAVLPLKADLIPDNDDVFNPISLPGFVSCSIDDIVNCEEIPDTGNIALLFAADENTASVAVFVDGVLIRVFTDEMADTNRQWIEDIADLEASNIVTMYTGVIVPPTPDPDPEPEPQPEPDVDPVLTPEQIMELGVRNLVERMYLNAFGRQYDVAGRDAWVNLIMHQNGTASDVARGFLSSSEFAGRQMSDEEFVTTLYSVFFNRVPSASEAANWTAALASGSTRGEIIEAFIASPEWAEVCAYYRINV